ncbi:hypothetical protein [Bifidobacterium sp. SO4]|uniref:hypothetical protein n=1 Tax=Bifidobacterium sp. SO4 TaxID=2809030 RepID=UPI001BDC8343|nr:hypothetical protein [Bifidobacterium sp. SO4]MBT1171245.1 hypothetical protein [Bifidobacterium sp. SO4]
MESYELDELRSKLDSMEFHLNSLEAANQQLSITMTDLTQRLDEIGRRDRDFQYAMWIQTDDGKRYKQWIDTWRPTWKEFLTLREVTERERRRYALEATRAAGFERKPEWTEYREREKNPIKRLVGHTPWREEYEKDLRRWQETYDAAIKPLPHASFFVEGGRGVVKQAEDTYKAVDAAIKDGRYATIRELIGATMPSFVYRYDAQVPDALPGVATWLREHRK